MSAATIRYRVRHATTYHYAEPVAISRNLLRLAPRPTAHQRVLAHALTLSPAAEHRTERSDWFGNAMVVATVQQPHTTLTITADSTVEVAPRPALPTGTPWDAVARALAAPFPQHGLRPAVEFRFASPLVPRADDLADLARPCFGAGRPLPDAALALCRLIHAEFRYDGDATTVDTPVLDVLRLRRGVCQDFAHLAVGALRSLGLAARYVSGYLETAPAPGRERLAGADASHAWLQVFDPAAGWCDLDPTNGCAADHRHVAVAWGRDVGDVSPTSGVLLGGGQSTVHVAVDVEREVDVGGSEAPARAGN